MSLIIIKLLLEMVRIFWVIGVLSLIIWGWYCYLESDASLLSDKALIAMISDDILGNPAYGKSCPRSSYVSDVESQQGGDVTSGYFVFNPVKGQEKHCPPIAIITNRKTAEARIADR